MNTVNLIGRLTRDPETKYTSSGMAITNFSLAVDRPVKQGEEKKADFPRITVFGKQAETCERYLTKGRKVAIEGRIQTGSYQDKDGKTVYTTDIVANRVEFLEWGDGQQQGQSSGGGYQQPVQQGGGYQQQRQPEPAYSRPYPGDEVQTEIPPSFEQINEEVPF